MAKKIVILGGGLTGLATAWRLAETGVRDVEIIESEPRLGGLSASVIKNGFIFDYGTHGLHSSKLGNEKIVEKVCNFMGSELIEVPRKASIFFKGKMFNFPLQINDVFLQLSPGLSIRCFLDFLKARIALKLKPNKYEGNFEIWIKNRFGELLYNIYFGPYTKKTWGVNPSGLSSDWATRRVAVISLWEVIKKAVFKKLLYREDIIHPFSPYRKSSYHGYKGIGVISAKISDYLISKGIKITLEYKVSKILMDSGRAHSIVVENDKNKIAIDCDYVVSTIPLNTFVSILESRRSEEVLEAARSLKYRAMVILFLAVNREKVSDYPWIYFSDDEFIFNRISEFKNSNQFTPKGKTALCIELTCFENDALWNMADKNIYEICMKALEKMNFLNRKDVEFHFVSRWSHVYPVWEVGYQKNMEIILKYFENIENIFMCGREGLFQYLNMDECFEHGFRVAEKLMSEIKNNNAVERL